MKKMRMLMINIDLGINKRLLKDTYGAQDFMGVRDRGFRKNESGSVCNVNFNKLLNVKSFDKLRNERIFKKRFYFGENIKIEKAP